MLHLPPELQLIMTHKTHLMASLLFTLVLCGCGGDNVGTVKGRVLLDGEPTGGFEVHFTSTGDGSTALGGAKNGGEFELFRGRGKREIPAGEYKVSLIPTDLIEGVPLPSKKIAEELKKAETTPIVKTVNGGGNVIDIEVTSVPGKAK